MNDNLNYDNTEINLDDFSVTSQDHFFTFDDSDLLSRDNHDTEDFIIPNDLIKTKNSGYIAFKVQEKVKYEFNFPNFNVLNNVGYLFTRNQYDIKVIRYLNHHVQKLCYIAKC